MATINMQTMRYINLLDRVSNVKTTKCFIYNNVIIFAVPERMVSKAIGNNGKNIKAIQLTLGKKIKVIKEVRDEKDVERFLQDIVEPAEFKSVEIRGDELVITAGNRTRAATLIGRNKVRYAELHKIVQDRFGKELRIV